MVSTGEFRYSRAAEREARRRQRELARLEKEKAKLSALELARLEVESYENELDVLLSIHKEPCQPWDWIALASALPPPPPIQYFYHESRAKQLAVVSNLGRSDTTKTSIEKARMQDESEFQQMTQSYSSELANTKKFGMVSCGKVNFMTIWRLS